MSRLRICASSRCFFPKGAYFFSTAEMANLAKEVGYEGIEFLPTWRFFWEMRRYGRWFYQLKNKEDWLFPPSDFCLSALKKFQKKYRVPISTTWFADTKNFSPVMLELWSKVQGIDHQGLMKWLKDDPKTHGVVIDTAKFTSWLESNDLLSKRKQVVKQLLPHTFEVHYRFKKKGLDQAMSLGKNVGILRDDSDENLKLILEQGFRGRIIVELGWPDVEQNVVEWRGDWRQFREIHKAIIAFINSQVG